MEHCLVPQVKGEGALEACLCRQGGGEGGVMLGPDEQLAACPGCRACYWGEPRVVAGTFGDQQGWWPDQPMPDEQPSQGGPGWDGGSGLGGVVAAV